MSSNGVPNDQTVDFRSLIETKIPTGRSTLEDTHTNLNNVARFCEDNYLREKDKLVALEQTKQYALQSLASVAYLIDGLAKDLLDMLDSQSSNINHLTTTVECAAMSVNLHKEKNARREIGQMTTNKNVQKQQKIIILDTQEPVGRYKRTPIDFSQLDTVGHGVRVVDTNSLGGVSRMPSSLSSNNYSHYAHFASPANMNNTLSRASMRSAMNSLQQEHHYRVPQTVPVVENSRLSGLTSGTSGISTNSHSSQSRYSQADRYGTLRANQFPRPDATSNIPLPPHINSSNYAYSDGGGSDNMGDVRYGGVNDVRYGGLADGRYGALNDGRYGAATDRRYGGVPDNCYGGVGDARYGGALSPGMDDDPMPPPPSAFFDTQSDWVPRQYLEKAMAIYDYEADKPDELSLRANCIVYVLRKNEDGWYEGVLDGVTGLFPGNYVRPSLQGRQHTRGSSPCAM